MNIIKQVFNFKYRIKVYFFQFQVHTYIMCRHIRIKFDKYDKVTITTLYKQIIKQIQAFSNKTTFLSI